MYLTSSFLPYTVKSFFFFCTLDVILTCSILFTNYLTSVRFKNAISFLFNYISWPIWKLHKLFCIVADEQRSLPIFWGLTHFIVLFFILFIHFLLEHATKMIMVYIPNLITIDLRSIFVFRFFITLIQFFDFVAMWADAAKLHFEMRSQQFQHINCAGRILPLRFCTHIIK